eukprot:gene26428-1726_t
MPADVLPDRNPRRYALESRVWNTTGRGGKRKRVRPGRFVRNIDKQLAYTITGTSYIWWDKQRKERAGRLSPEENAALQGFPAAWEFLGGEGLSTVTMIGVGVDLWKGAEVTVVKEFMSSNKAPDKVKLLVGQQGEVVKISEDSGKSTKDKRQLFRVTKVRMVSAPWALDRFLKVKDTIVKTGLKTTPADWDAVRDTTICMRPNVELTMESQIQGQESPKYILKLLHKLTSNTKRIVSEAGGQLKIAAQQFLDIIKHDTEEHWENNQMFMAYKLVDPEEFPDKWPAAELDKYEKVFYKLFNNWQINHEADPDGTPAEAHLSEKQCSIQLSAVYNNKERNGAFSRVMHRCAVGGARDIVPFALMLDQRFQTQAAAELSLRAHKAILTALRNRQKRDTAGA